MEPDRPLKPGQVVELSAHLQLPPSYTELFQVRAHTQLAQICFECVLECWSFFITVEYVTFALQDCKEETHMFIK